MISFLIFARGGAVIRPFPPEARAAPKNIMAREGSSNKLPGRSSPLRSCRTALILAGGSIVDSKLGGQ
jgi:hypothetical protein